MRRPALSRPAPRALLLGLVLCLGTGTALVPAASAASLPAAATIAAASADVIERPASGVFAVDGHGWGHGHGLSQWGAQGAASLGVSADQIVSTYYPGTARGVLPNAPIRVLLQGDDGTDTQVYAASGLSVTDLANGRRTALPAGPSRWRAVPTSAGLRLDALTGSTWTPGATSAGPLRFSGPSFVRVAFPDGTSRDYRGAVQAVRTSATRLQSIVVLGLEEYLLGVVPRESSSSWLPAALQAQAIAARSYSANERDRVAGAGSYDICDTTQCQVFGGSALYTASGRIPLEPDSTTAAVRATAGVVRVYGGKAIFAEFSSSNGGWSTNGDVPYLSARRDDWDGAVPNPVHTWHASLPASDVERRYPAVGHLQRVRISRRDGNGEWGGRVQTVVLEGVDGSGRPTSVSTTGAGLYFARTWPARSDGFRSTWFRLVGDTAAASPVAPPAASPIAPPTASSPPPPTPPSTVDTLTAAYDGLPTSPAPAPAVPAVFADGRTVVVPRSGETTVQIALRNTGSVAWPVGPASPVMLGTSGPRNRSSRAVGSDWASATRAARLVRAVDGSSAVRPGASGVFELVLHGNGLPVGTASEAFEPLWSGRGWLTGAARTLNVVRTDPAVPHLAALHSAPATSPAIDGSDVLVVRLRNYGGAAWRVGSEQLRTVGGTAYALASRWPTPTTPPALASNAIRPGAVTVEPGEIGEWRVPVSSLGRAPGTYELALQPVAAGGPYGPVVRMRVTTAGTVASRSTAPARPLFKGSGPRVLSG